MMKRLSYCLEDGKSREEGEILERHHRMPDGKLIVTAQICIHCGRKLPFKPNRSRCPYCHGILRVKTIVVKNVDSAVPSQ